MSAYPTILINSATGSDSAASGAGPSTAISGTSAVPTTTSVAIADAVNLSGVALDGSACLYLADSTAGHLNFSQITNITGSSGAWVVTVATAYTTSASTFSWAIGGARASIGSTTSRKLLSNNSGIGDAPSGWTIQCQSGHSETVSTTIKVYGTSSTPTNGPLTIQGAPGAATTPVITISANASLFTVVSASYTLGLTIAYLDLRCSSGSKSANAAIIVQNPLYCARFVGLKINDPTNFSGYGLYFNNAVYGVSVESCDVQNTEYNACIVTVSSQSLRFKNNYWGKNAGASIYLDGSSTGLEIDGDIFAYGGADDVLTNLTTVNILGVVIRNTVFGGGSAGSGINIQSTSSQYGVFGSLLIENCEFTFKSAYGINFSGSGVTDALLASFNVVIRNNNFYSNTSGKYNGMTVVSSINETTVDPSGGLASATKDYAGTVSGTNFMAQGTNQQGLGFPIGGTLPVGMYTSSYNYQDIGLQKQASGGGGGGVVVGSSVIRAAGRR